MTRVFEQPSDALTTFLVLSERPRDFPDAYVVRAQAMFAGEKFPGDPSDTEIQVSPAVMLFPSETAARQWIASEYPEFEERGRDDCDEPQILSVWVTSGLKARLAEFESELN